MVKMVVTREGEEGKEGKNKGRQERPHLQKKKRNNRRDESTMGAVQSAGAGNKPLELKDLLSRHNQMD